MPKRLYFAMTVAERELICDALSAFADHDGRRCSRIRVLRGKLSHSDGKYPDITVGVYGGSVQWVIGNPFPIRVCDYDGENEDLAGVDARGQSCNTWLEPPSP